MRRFTVMVFIALVLSAAAHAQDLMKAEWYTTKRQVITAEGLPQKEEDDTLIYDIKKINGYDFKYGFIFNERMLQEVVAIAKGPFLNELLDSFIEQYGRPVVEDGWYRWKTKKYLIELFPEEQTIFLYLYPTDKIFNR